MRKILLTGLLMLLGIGITLSCQSTAQKTATAPAAKETAAEVTCPLEKMGVTCPCGDLCPKQGKGPCAVCTAKAKQMAGLSLQWRAALQAKDYDQALKTVRQMDELVPNNSNIKASFALVYTLKGEYDQALAVYNEMLKGFPDDATLLGNIANVYALKGDYDKALELFNQILVRYANEPRITNAILNAIASVYIKKGDFEKTIETYNKVLQANPKDNGTLYNVGCAYSLKGLKKEACEYLNKAMECGYWDWKYIEKDTDLDNIRSEDAYKKIMESLKIKSPDGLKPVANAGACGGDCKSCPSNGAEAVTAADHKHMHDGCDQCPDHDKCLKEGKCMGDCDKKIKDAQGKKCDGTCDHTNGKDDPKYTGDCAHKDKK